MSRRAVEIPVFRSPSGDVVEARVSFALVDANLQRVLGLDADGEAVIDSAIIISTEEAQSVELTATDTLEPTALYRVTVSSQEHKRNRAIVFLAIVPSGEGELPWADVVAYAEWLESGPELVDRILPDPTDLPDGYTAVVSGGQWVGSDEVVSINGREIELRVSGNLLQQRYVGDLAWTTIYNLATLAGEDGKNPELSVVGGYLVYRLAGSSTWIQLYPMASLVGAQGPGTEWRTTSTHIQARAVGSATWVNVILLDDLRGADGTSFRILGSFVDLSELSGLTPEAGDGYLNSVTGHLWAWDGATWVDAGEIRGPAGQSPEFAVVSGVFSWRYIGESAWTAIYALEDVTGPPGSDADVTAHVAAFNHALIATALQPSDVGTAAAQDVEDFDAAGAATAAITGHEEAFEHDLIATALQPSDVGTAAAEDSEAFDPAGSASSAVSAHNSAFDHSKIATALQPADIHNGVGGLVAVVEEVDIPEDGEPVLVTALPRLSMRNLTEIERILPPMAPGTTFVAVPASPDSPGEIGQVAVSDSHIYTYTPSGWHREPIEVDWENLAFVGPNLSPLHYQPGEAITPIVVSGRFKGIGRTYTLVDAPAWMSIDSSGVITGTPTIGYSASVKVRASLDGQSADSNAFTVSVSYDYVTDFNEFADGDWSETYLKSNANAILEVAPGGPANSGKLLRVKNNNLTTNQWWSQKALIAGSEVTSSAWEMLALVRISSTSCRVGIGWMDAVADAPSVASLGLQFADATPSAIMVGSAYSGAAGLYPVTPAEWLNQYVWLNVRASGVLAQARIWRHGETQPNWQISRTYAAPTSFPADSGLGFFCLHRQTNQQMVEFVYVAATVGGPALQIPTWTVPSFPVIAPGALSYLNAWPARTREVSGGEARVAAFDYPLVGVGDHSGDSGTQYRGLFKLYAATGLNALTGTSPECIKLVKVTTGEYQRTPNTLFSTTQNINCLSPYTDEDENRLFPGHVAFQFGTTLVNGLPAGTANEVLDLAVADATNIRVDTTSSKDAQMALISPIGGVTPANVDQCEWVYVISKNMTTTPHTIRITRGWRAPLYQSGASLQRTHPAGAYIASVTTGGAATSKSASNGNPVNVNKNWKWNISSQCPLDSNGTTIIPHILSLVGRRLSEAEDILGYPPDGMYDDVDRSFYNSSQEGALDADNSRNGIDRGYSGTGPSAVSWWQQGDHAMKTAIVDTYGPGTAMDCKFFMAGTRESDVEIFNGTEFETSYFDSSWTTDAVYTRYDQEWQTSLVNLTQVESGLGPPIHVNLCRVFTKSNPCLQDTFQSANPGPCSYGATDNSDARLNMCLSWAAGAFFAMPQSGQHFPYWDEYAADPSDGYVCPELSPANAARIVSLSGWMGKPKGPFVRHYDAAAMALANNISGIDMTAATNPLAVSGATASRQTSGGVDNAAYWRYTQTTVSSAFSGSRVSKTFTGLAVGQYYTAVIWMRSDRIRHVEVNISADTSAVVWTPGQAVTAGSFRKKVQAQHKNNNWVYEAMVDIVAGSPESNASPETRGDLWQARRSLGGQAITEQWLPHVYAFKATATSQYMAISFGWMIGRLEVGRWVILPGLAAGISRDFDRALVLANPTPDPLTFTLPGGATYKRLTGTQEPTINNGATVSGSITIPARDGLVLGKVL